MLVRCCCGQALCMFACFATHLAVPNEHLLAHFWGLMGALSKVQLVRSALPRNDGPRHVVGRGLEKGHEVGLLAAFYARVGVEAHKLAKVLKNPLVESA